MPKMALLNSSKSNIVTEMLEPSSKGGTENFTKGPRIEKNKIILQLLYIVKYWSTAYYYV